MHSATLVGNTQTSNNKEPGPVRGLRRCTGVGVYMEEEDGEA